MIDSVHLHPSVVFSSLLSRVPAKLCYHLAGAVCGLVFTHDDPGSSALDCFQLLSVSYGVLSVPQTKEAYPTWPHQAGGALGHLARFIQEAECTVRLLRLVIHMVIPG